MSDASLETRLVGYDTLRRGSVVLAVARLLVRDVITSGDDPTDAYAALSAIEHWLRDRKPSGRAFSDLVYSEQGDGLALHTMRGHETAATDAWNGLIAATMYIGWHAYRTDNEAMPGDMAEVGEDTLDVLFDYWCKTMSFSESELDQIIRNA